MSGSPVLIDGRLAGAVAYRFASTLDTTFPFAATSLDAVLQSKPGATPPTQNPTDTLPVQVVVSAGGGHAAPALTGVPSFPATALPVATSGAGLSGKCLGNDDCDGKRLSAGDSIAVILLTGDLFTYAAMGTVTAVDGDRVWAFGHPFLANGDTGLPFSAAQVFGLYADPSAGPRKVMQPVGPALGTIQRDDYSGIAGSFGSADVPSLSITTTWTNGDVPDASAATATHSMPLLLFDVNMQGLAQTAIADSLDLMLDHALGDGNVAVQASVSFVGSAARLKHSYAREGLTDVYDANAAWAGELIGELGDLMQRFPDHPAEQLDVSGRYSDTPAQLVLESCEVRGPAGGAVVSADQTLSIQPGQSLQVTVHALDTRAQRIVDFDTSLRVPADVAPEPLTLFVSPDQPATSKPATVVSQYARTFEQEIESRNATASADTEDDFFVGLYLVDQSHGTWKTVDEARVAPGTSQAVVAVGVPVVMSGLLSVPAVQVLAPTAN
jgi:hypothetical protein